MTFEEWWAGVVGTCTTPKTLQFPSGIKVVVDAAWHSGYSAAMKEATRLIEEQIPDKDKED